MRAGTTIVEETDEISLRKTDLKLDDLKRADLKRALTAPLMLNNGTVIRNLRDACLWLQHVADSRHPEMRKAAQRVVEAIDGGSIIVASNMLRFAAHRVGQLKVR